MRPRKLLGVGDMPLVGGAVCLDFVNTTGARASHEPRERLRSIRDVRIWARRAGISRSRRTGGGLSAERPEQALERLYAVRETLYRIFRESLEKRRPRADDIRQLDQWSREDRLRRELVFASDGLTLRLIPGSSESDRLVSAVVESAIRLLQSNRIASLKRCAECDWLFLDETKNQSRTWCKNTCGDRVRARRHYRGARRVRHAQATHS
jgi:predicted RNA-binding Zn ribbon-like protein